MQCASAALRQRCRIQTNPAGEAATPITVLTGRKHPLAWAPARQRMVCAPAGSVFIVPQAAGILPMLIHFTRRSKLPVAHHSRKSRFAIERLEDRLALAGFGPEDGAYIVESWEGSYGAVEVRQSDQTVVAAGGLSSSATAVARYDVAGSIDLTFGNNGVGTVPVPITCNSPALALQADGKAVIGGRVTSGGQTSIAVGRLTASGLPDTRFDRDGASAPMEVTPNQGDEACAVAIQSTGKIVVAGRAGYSTGNLVIGRFTAGGAVDSGNGGFGQTVKGKPVGYTVTNVGAAYPDYKQLNTYYAIAVSSDDKIVAVGTLDGPGEDTQIIVARYTPAGSLDTSFNGAGYTVFRPAGFTRADASAVAVQADGKIVVAGTSTGQDLGTDMLIARFNTNGTLDATFGGAGYVRIDVDDGQASSREWAKGVVIQPDGKIVAAGFVHGPGNLYRVLVARLNTDGALDAGFGIAGLKLGALTAGRSSVGTCVALQSDGSIIVAGYDEDTATGSDRHPLLMRFYGDNAPAAASSTTDAAATDAALLLYFTEDAATVRRRK